MRKLTTVFGILFVLLGLGLYFGSGRESVTALIPAFLGVIFLLCAAVATTEKRRMHAMHVAVLFALIGLGGSATGVVGAVKALGGTTPDNPQATYGRAVMAVLCVIYIVAAVRSFIAARKARGATS